MKRGKFVRLCVLVFIIALIFGAASKFLFIPSWAKKYQVKWSDEIGTLYKDISYGDKESNKFDMYVPNDNTRENYGLVVYLHAGGFTTGDKSEDEEILAWLCSKGYVAVGINYTLRTEENDASVLTQANEIKDAMPVVVEEAKKHGYDINAMTISGGSAGGALAMIYAYKYAEESPVPIKLMFEMVGPSSYYVEDWGIYGLDQDTDESREAAAGLFGVMAGVELTKEQIKDGSYQEYMKPISSFMYINENSVPSVLLYGTEDKVQPYKGVRHLKQALKDNEVDYKMFVATHSGHGVQNDDKVMKEYMETVEEYLDKYMPIEK